MDQEPIDSIMNTFESISVCLSISPSVHLSHLLQRFSCANVRWTNQQWFWIRNPLGNHWEFLWILLCLSVHLSICPSKPSLREVLRYQLKYSCGLINNEFVLGIHYKSIMNTLESSFVCLSFCPSVRLSHVILLATKLSDFL